MGSQDHNKYCRSNMDLILKPRFSDREVGFYKREN